MDRTMRFGPSRQKIDRAEKHIDELKSIISRFRDLNPYRLVVEKKMSPPIDSYAGTFPGRLAFHYKIIAVYQIPAEVSIVFGDAIHNLRAALDFIAFDVTPKNDGNRKFTGFPFHETAENFYRDINLGRLVDIPEHLKNVFRSVEAFRGGKGDALWQMNKLDIIDKHRMLIASEFITGLEFPTPICLGSDLFTGRLSNRQPEGSY